MTTCSTAGGVDLPLTLAHSPPTCAQLQSVKESDHAAGHWYEECDAILCRDFIHGRFCSRRICHVSPALSTVERTERILSHLSELHSRSPNFSISLVNNAIWSSRVAWIKAVEACLDIEYDIAINLPSFILTARPGQPGRPCLPCSAPTSRNTKRNDLCTWQHELAKVTLPEVSRCNQGTYVNCLRELMGQTFAASCGLWLCTQGT
jgi:hypothetical protein